MLSKQLIVKTMELKFVFFEYQNTCVAVMMCGFHSFIFFSFNKIQFVTCCQYRRRRRLSSFKQLIFISKFPQCRFDVKIQSYANTCCQLYVCVCVCMSIRYIFNMYFFICTFPILMPSKYHLVLVMPSHFEGHAH